VGQQKYYVLGWDSLTETPLASLGGHLGRIDDTKFIELMTKTMYYNPTTILHDMQKTILSYAKAHDGLTASSLLKEFMDSFDENNDGIIDYDEMGRKGIETAAFSMLAHSLDLQITAAYGTLKGNFIESTYFLKYADRNWNSQGHDFVKEKMLVSKAAGAFGMSQSEAVNADLFVPGMTFGRRMWPSWQTVTYILSTSCIYGSQSPDSINLGSLYGRAFQYADKVLKAGIYTGSIDQQISDPNSIDRYYVPAGYGSLGKLKIPNVEETEDPKKIFTAHFNGGREVW
jgi:hypothetical protein